MRTAVSIAALQRKLTGGLVGHNGTRSSGLGRHGQRGWRVVSKGEARGRSDESIHKNAVERQKMARASGTRDGGRLNP